MKRKESVKAKIVKLYNEDVTVKELSKKFKYSEQTIYRIIREAGPKREEPIIKEESSNLSTQETKMTSPLFKFPKTESLSVNQQLRLYKEFVAAIALEQWISNISKNSSFND